jgi:hypothetical protein
MQRRCRQLFAISIGEPIVGIERIRLKHHEALMSGRFDQQVTVNSPHIAGREVFFSWSHVFTGEHRNNRLPQNLGNTAYLLNEVFKQILNSIFLQQNKYIFYQNLNLLLARYSGHHFAHPCTKSRDRTLENAEAVYSFSQKKLDLSYWINNNDC